VAKSQTIADRLAQRVTADMPDLCRRHHDEASV
jgi:hypothetical protein